MKLQQFFNKHPVFHYEEFANFMEERGIDKPTTWRQALSYHRKVGHLLRIRKYLYAVKPPGLELDECWVDPYLIAAKATEDAVISHHSALELHELAYTSFEKFTYLTQHQGKPFTYQTQTFRPIPYPKTLVTQGCAQHNVIQMNRQGLTIQVTDLQRTVVDILDRPDLSGGWEEIWRSLDHLVHFDPNQMIDYALLRGNATIVAKVGYFLEQRPSHLSVEPQLIDRLLTHIPKQPHYMNRDRKGKSKYFKKWQLIVPIEIVERQWEEPHVGDI